MKLAPLLTCLAALMAAPALGQGSEFRTALRDALELQASLPDLAPSLPGPREAHNAPGVETRQHARERQAAEIAAPRGGSSAERSNAAQAAHERAAAVAGGKARAAGQGAVGQARASDAKSQGKRLGQKKESPTPP
jgi:hypothetical protein